jgi:hypothetical protein
MDPPQVYVNPQRRRQFENQQQSSSSSSSSFRPSSRGDDPSSVSTQPTATSYHRGNSQSHYGYDNNTNTLSGTSAPVGNKSNKAHRGVESLVPPLVSQDSASLTNDEVSSMFSLTNSYYSFFKLNPKYVETDQPVANIKNATITTYVPFYVAAAVGHPSNKM